MTPFVQDADFTLYVGDALAVLRELPDESVHCCVTSPPYWGLRDYGSEGQLGLEASKPDEFVAAMVGVFREVRRVLMSDGSLWLNLGDSYAGGGGGNNGNKIAPDHGQHLANVKNRPAWLEAAGLKSKDMVGIPWRVAFALQADGWYLRSDIVWSKPNPMPESVTDRPTKAHEYVFLLTKSPRYFFDQEAVRERYEGDPEYRYGRVGAYQIRAQGGGGDGTTPTSVRGPDGRRKTTVKGAEGSIQHRDGERWPNGGRNLRSVWEIATQPYPDAHFATFPEALPERCIKAGTSERGCCPECGAPWERVVSIGEPELDPRVWSGKGVTQYDDSLRGMRDMAGTASTLKHTRNRDTTGWSPSCGHDLDVETAKHHGVCPVCEGYGGRGESCANVLCGGSCRSCWCLGCRNGEVPEDLRTGELLAVDPDDWSGSFAAYRALGGTDTTPMTTVPCTVLDPFMGSGTTALVARKLGRRSIGIELNPEYAQLAARRLQQLALPFAEAAS